jgi:hypothetical protein
MDDATGECQRSDGQTCHWDEGQSSLEYAECERQRDKGNLHREAVEHKSQRRRGNIQ